MNATAKKNYSLVSAILLVVLSVVLLVGAIMPIFRINMASVPVAEAFENGQFTADLEVDEGKIGLGNAIKLAINYKYVSIINSIQFKTQKIATLRAEIFATPDASNEWRKVRYDEISVLEAEIQAILSSLTQEDYEKMQKLFKSKGFVEALYAEISIVSLFVDAIESNSNGNYKYNTNILDVFSVVFGLIFFVIFMVFLTIFSLITFFSALKKLLSLATGFKSLNLRKLESLYAGKALSALLPTLLFYTLAKTMLGSKILMGLGLWIILGAATLISLVRAANKIILKERRNPKHIARVIVGLATFILVLCVFNNVTNMNLVESYYRSNDANAFVLYEGEVDIDFNDQYSSTASPSKAVATEILTKNAVHLLFATLLLSILTFTLLAYTYNRLRENHNDFNSSYGAEKCGYFYVRALVIILCVLFTTTLGVNTVVERDQAYEHGGVKILWDDYTLEGSGTKEEYDLLVSEHNLLLEQIKAAESQLKDIKDKETKETYKFQLDMAKRHANKLALKIDALQNDDTATRTATITLLIAVIILEVIYRALPGVVDKYLSDKVKRLLAGNASEVVDLSMGGTAPAVPASAPASTPSSHSAPPASPAPGSYSPPAKEKSFKDDDDDTTTGGGSADEDDLATQMQRLYDSQN